ncbi:MAG: DUF3653 domain-containing protein [Methylophilus sp.]|uniref:DUF3653 domain-containing protein n=1 Tax=Methylophilus sp. TaxID=29541 RepID=UPI003FA0C040
MRTKSINNENKLATKSKIEWYLRVGWHFGTLNGPKDVMDILQIDRFTFYRWSTGRSCAPYAALELLRLHAFGEPPGGRSKAWRDFRFYRDRLITEDGRVLSPGDLKAVFFWKQMAFNQLDERGRREIYTELKAIYRQA